jgi:hypothetical protein
MSGKEEKKVNEAIDMSKAPVQQGSMFPKGKKGFHIDFTVTRDDDGVKIDKKIELRK